MQRTRIVVIFGALINGKYQHKTEPGSIAMHVRNFIQSGWQVIGERPNGSVLIEKDGSRYLLGDQDAEEQEITEEEDYPQIAG